MGHISICVFRDELSRAIENHLGALLSYAAATVERQFIAFGGITKG
jgi:hypothetical protein